MATGLIPYDVVYCTSQDPEHPITELAGNDPDEAETIPDTSLTGWQSEAGGKVPQTIVLRFPGVVWLHQLRILSHESKIASKVEVRVFKLKHTDVPGGAAGEMSVEEAPSFRTARFTKLGTVDFNNNEHSQYKAKERKTVHLKTEAYFVKLLFDRAHHNPLNAYEQIGLYAIECIGYMVAPVRHHMDRVIGAPSPTAATSSLASSTDTSVVRPLPQFQTDTATGDGRSYPPNGPRPSARGSGVAPSSFPAQRRGSVASHSSAVESNSPRSAQARSERDFLGSSTDIQPFRSVRILEFEEFFLRRSEELLSLKEQAIAVEDFETATQCRDKLTRMNQHSRRIYQLEQDKVQAIIEEDFDRAKEVRDRMDAAVQQAFADAKLPELRHATRSPPHAPETAKNEEREEAADDERMTAASDGGSDAIGFHADEEEESAAPRYRNEPLPTDPKVAGSPGRSGATGASRSRGSIVANGSRYNEESPVGVAADATSAFDEIPVGPGRSSFSAVRNDSVDDMHVSRMDPGETVLKVHDIPGASNGAERVVANEILAATGEEENGTVVFADVNVDLRQLLSCVGQFPTACLVSRRFKLREAALTVLTEAMHDQYKETAAHVEDAVLRFLDYNGFGLQDTIPNVVFAACTFVRMTLFDECRVLSEVSSQVALLLPRLLTRAADPLPRIRDEAITTLTLYVKTGAAPLPPYVAAVLSDPMDKERRKVPTTNPRAQLARLAALQILLDSDRTPTFADTTTSSFINKLLIPSVNHPNFDVRDLGTAVFRKFVDVLGVTLRERDVARINNAAIKEAIVGGGKRTKR